MAITLADFTKIWASTSPLTPYSFSDSNYQEGWNFIGSTPPARQMWDFIQKQNDEKLKYIVDNFLPTTGGTMTGAIVGNPLTLTADDGNGNSADLVANANGNLTWNNKQVAIINYLGDAPNNTATDFNLPTSGTYIVVTGHNSTAGVNSIWIVRTGGNTAFNMGGGSNITMTCSNTTITVTSSSGLANVWGILLAQ